MHTYQPGAFLVEHLAALSTSLLSTGSTLVAGRGLERLVDYRAQPPLEFASAAAGHYLELDMGGPTMIGALFIPSAHNIGGNVSVKSGGSPAPTTTRATAALNAGTPALLTWTGVADRYWRFTIDPSGAWQVPELVYATQQRTFVAGVHPQWSQKIRSAVTVAEFAAFESAAVLGPGRREWRIRFEAMEADADLDAWEALQRVGRSRPVVFVPPDATIGVPAFVRFEDDPESEQFSPNPSAGIRYTGKAVLVEQL